MLADNSHNCVAAIINIMTLYVCLFSILNNTEGRLFFCYALILQVITDIILIIKKEL